MNIKILLLCIILGGCVGEQEKLQPLYVGMDLSIQPSTGSEIKNLRVVYPDGSVVEKYTTSIYQTDTLLAYASPYYLLKSDSSFGSGSVVWVWVYYGGKQTMQSYESDGVNRFNDTIWVRS